MTDDTDLSQIIPRRSLASTLSGFSAQSWRMLGNPLFQLQMLLAVSLVLGGGGVGYGIRNLLIQIFALGLLAFNLGRVRQFFSQSPWFLIALVGFTLALPLIQLVPLPPSLWQAMPGREPIVQAFAIANIPLETWVPWSVDRARTFVAFCGLIAPATIVILGATLKRDELKTLAWTAVAIALAAFAWGVVQLTSANSFGLLYPIRPQSDVMYGFFANRNSMGLYFVIALIFAAALPPAKEQSAKLVKPVLIAFLLLGVILTQSRSGMALLVIPLAFGLSKLAWVAFRANRDPSIVPSSGPRLRLTRWGRFRRNRAQKFTALFALALVGAMGLSLAGGGRVADSLERFSTIDVDRLGMWDDAQYAARQYWPVGSGMGTFDEVFQLHESLEYVSPRRAGRAHNDYLELGMEAGLAGLILIVGWLGWLALATWRLRSRLDPWLAFGGSAGLSCIVLQSLLDYPLRNQAILCLAALLIAILARPKTFEKPEEKQ